MNFDFNIQESLSRKVVFGLRSILGSAFCHDWEIRFAPGVAGSRVEPNQIDP